MAQTIIYLLVFTYLQYAIILRKWLWEATLKKKTSGNTHIMVYKEHL